MYVPTGGRDVVPGGKVRVRSVTRDSDGVLAVAIYIYIYIYIWVLLEVYCCDVDESEREMMCLRVGDMSMRNSRAGGDA